jgi:hypothetical protein
VSSEDSQDGSDEALRRFVIPGAKEVDALD